MCIEAIDGDASPRTRPYGAQDSFERRINVGERP